MLTMSAGWSERFLNSCQVVGGNDGDASASYHLALAVNNDFDVAIENDEDLLIRVAMFIGTLTGSAGYDEERSVRSILHSLESSGTPTGRSKAADVDDVQLRLL